MFDDRFVAVTPSVLVDPLLKLRLEQGRWNPGSSARGGSQAIHLSWDPELRADRLTMPVPTARRERLEVLGPLGQDRTVFESGRTRRIATVTVAIHERRDEVRLECAVNRRSLEVGAQLVAQEGIAGLSDRPWELLLHMYRSIALMPDWAERYALPWGKNRISVAVAASVARELGARTGVRFPASLLGRTRLAQRELQP